MPLTEIKKRGIWMPRTKHGGGRISRGKQVRLPPKLYHKTGQMAMKPTRERAIYDIQKIFRWIVAYKTQHDGNSPSIVELMHACGISSRSVALYQLHRLQDAGYIRLTAYRQTRSICIVGGEWRLQGVMK
jgi:hypothetical protein